MTSDASSTTRKLRVRQVEAVKTMDETQPIIDQPLRVARAYEKVAEVLRQRILSGALREGDRLPPETALADQAGVSRSTVREALRTLQEAGLIERASPKIMVVRRHDYDPAYRELTHALRRRKVTFHHLHEALLMIEPELTRLAAQRAEPGDIAELHTIVAAQERNIEHFKEWSRLDEEFHLTIAEMSANPALIIARTPITQLLLPTLSHFIVSSTLTRHALRYHHRILHEVESREPELAAAVVRRHVDDFRAAWEKAGLDFNLQVADLGGTPLAGAA
jgi:DNA-binding FadR family transcriptional regulator